MKVRVIYKDTNINAIQLSKLQIRLSDFKIIQSLLEEIILTYYKIYNELNQHSSLGSSMWDLVAGHWKIHLHIKLHLINVPKWGTVQFLSI